MYVIDDVQVDGAAKPDATGWLGLALNGDGSNNSYDFID